MKAPPLYAHQKESIKILARSPRIFDTSDPGIGKTRVEIEDFAKKDYRAALQPSQSSACSVFCRLRDCVVVLKGVVGT